MTIELGLLGEVAVRVDGVEVELGPARQRCVLAALLVDTGRVVPVGRITERVWGDRLPQRARTTLSSYVSRLRRALEPAPGVALLQRSAGYLLDAEHSAIDLHRFRRLRSDARSLAGSGEAEAAARTYAQALRLWRGDALSGLDGDWATAERDRLTAERFAVECDLVDVLLATGRAAHLLPDLGSRTAAHPFDERVATQYMLALHHAGRTTDALEHYRSLHARLAEDLGTDPGEAVRLVQRRILAADPALLVPAPLAPPASPVSTRVPRQLPAPPASFVGRRDEVSRLDANGEAAAITVLTGAGGMGKTWLALHWADRVVDRFPDGQLFVDLRGFSPDAAPMDPAIAVCGFLDALGVPPGRIPAAPHARIALFRSLVADRRLLILLDNARDTTQVTPLLPGGGSCAVLITSRDDLAGLVVTGGARTMPVDCFDDDEARDVLGRFVQPHQVHADPAAMVALVRHCAGLPLALGIVGARAARHPRFPLANLAAEFADETERLDAFEVDGVAGNLRAVIACSYRALGPEAARTFRLPGCAFGPDISVAAAARLVDRSEARTRGSLRELERVHLVEQHEPGRYRTHDLVRLYARHVTPGELEPAAVEGLLDFYVEEAARRTTGDVQWRTSWLSEEYDNLIAAGDLVADRGWHDHTWRLANALWYFRYTRGHGGDWAASLERALTAAVVVGNEPGEAATVKNLGAAYFWNGRLDDAVRCFHRALDLNIRLGDQRSAAAAANNLGVVHMRLGRHEQALAHYRDSVHRHERAGSLVTHCGVLGNMAMVLAKLGDVDAAVAHCEQALLLHRESGVDNGAGHSLGSLGVVWRIGGRLDRSLDLLRRSLVVLREAEDRTGECEILNEIGETLRRQGDLVNAAAAYEQVLAQAETMENSYEFGRARAGIAAVLSTGPAVCGTAGR